MFRGRGRGEEASKVARRVFLLIGRAGCEKICEGPHDVPAGRLTAMQRDIIFQEAAFSAAFRHRASWKNRGVTTTGRGLTIADPQANRAAARHKTREYIASTLQRGDDDDDAGDIGNFPPRTEHVCICFCSLYLFLDGYPDLLKSIWE